MPERKTNFFRKILELRIFLVINVIILLFLTLSFGREFMRDWEIDRQIAASRAEAEELQAHNLEIVNLNNQLSSQTYIEGEARIRLGLAKPGERLVVVIDESTDQLDTSSESEANFSKPSVSFPAADGENTETANPVRWWYYFFNHNKFESIKIYGD